MASYSCIMRPSPEDLNRARYVRTLLAYHGHNQTDLGQIIGVTQANASQKLRGQRRFHADELLAIADHYGLDPGTLMRPPLPELVSVLGAVRSAEGGLLTCTFNALPQVRAGVCLPGGLPAKSGVFPHRRAA